MPDTVSGHPVAARGIARSALPNASGRGPGTVAGMETTPLPATFGLTDAAEVTEADIRPGMDIARLVTTALGPCVESLRVAAIEPHRFVAARGGELPRGETGARWFALTEATTPVQSCPGCGEEVTLVHGYAHRRAVHVASDSRWCTTETGPVFPAAQPLPVAS